MKKAKLLPIIPKVPLFALPHTFLTYIYMHLCYHVYIVVWPTMACPSFNQIDWIFRLPFKDSIVWSQATCFLFYTLGLHFILECIETNSDSSNIPTHGFKTSFAFTITRNKCGVT